MNRFLSPGLIVVPRRSLRDRPAFTLIEMLVSLAITLIMMGAVVSLFGLISDSVSDSRSIIEISERLRNARNIIQEDLNGATAPLTPPLRTEDDQGYLLYAEGEKQDNWGLGTPNTSPFGDYDDYLAFTVRRKGEPFVGKFTPSSSFPIPYNTIETIESQDAEVIYFLIPDGPIIDVTTATPRRLYTLYRRVLLIAPQAATSIASFTLPSFYNDYDISVWMSGGKLRPNTLSELTKPERRMWNSGVYPYLLPPGNLQPFDPASGRLGDDVLLTNVLSFDVKIFDPGAPYFLVGPSGNQTAVRQGDAGYNNELSGGTPAAYGDYVDLGWNQAGYPGTPLPLFGNIPPSPFSTPPYRYDTWSLHYESNGLDEDDGGGGPIDEGTNGIDDNSNGIVDDPLERETQPPYPAAARGLKITIRVYEPGSQQVRQVTVVRDFLPE